MSRRGLIASAAVALIIALGVAAARGGFGAMDQRLGLQAWSDAFFVAGVCVGGTGMLSFAASDGLFDILRYGAGRVLRLMRSKEDRDLYPKTFFDYRMARRGRGPTGLSAMVVGAACLVVAGGLLGLYLKAV